MGILGILLLGLGLGYLFFHEDHTSDSPLSHTHAEQSEVWTCSMHPQIRQESEGQCPICGMDLIPATQSTSNDPVQLEMTSESVKLAQIETTVVGSGSLSGKRIILAGKIQADERRASSQVAHLPGRIEKLFVSFTGERIRAGQKIAQIYSPELITAQQELLEAKKLADTNPALLTSARKKLGYWRLTNAQIESIETSGRIQEKMDLFADTNGVVAQQNA